MDRFWQPRPKSRMASILESMSMIAEFGQQQWSYTNFRGSDRTLRSRDRIFELSQEMVKICAAARNLDTCMNFDRSGWYSTGEMPPIKAGRPELYGHLGSTCLRGNTPTSIWTRALLPDQEEVSSWRFCLVQIVSERQTFPPIFWLDAGILAWCGDFNACQSPIVCLYFYQAPIFWFFLPDLFLLIKKATAIFVTNYITGIIIYKICRYLHQNEYKAKFNNQIHLGDSFCGCFIFWALNTLYISLAKKD